MTVLDVFQSLPPKHFLLQLMDKVAKVYIFLWERRDINYRVVLDYKALGRYYHKNNFRTSLRKLLDLGLLSYEETETEVAVELTAWGDLDD